MYILCNTAYHTDYGTITLPKSECSDKLYTRKLSYCKDDRAMRPIYGCAENFREFLKT